MISMTMIVYVMAAMRGGTPHAGVTQEVQKVVMSSRRSMAVLVGVGHDLAWTQVVVT